MNVLFIKLLEARGDPRTLRRYAVALCAMIILPLLYSAVVFIAPKPEPIGTVKVAVIQPNIDPFAKWENSNRRAVLEKHIAVSDSAARGGVDLVVCLKRQFHISFCINAARKRGSDCNRASHDGARPY